MTKSKYLRLYEKLCPSDPIADNDPRRSVIEDDMRAVIAANYPKDAIPAITWWGWESDQELIGFIVRARRIWKTL